MKPDAVLSLVRAAVTETAYATVGLTAYAIDAVRRPPSPDEVKERATKAVGDPVRTLATTATALSDKGRQALGKAATPERSATATGAKEAMERAETATPATSESPDVAEPVAPPVAGPVPSRPAPAPTEPAEPGPAVEAAPEPAEPETEPETEPAGEVPLQHDLSELTVAELRQLAQDADIPGRSGMKKKHLIEALEEYRTRT